MKAFFVCTGLAVILAACAGQPPPPPKYVEGSACVRPGGRCAYSDQCCSEICDANNCRGPMPGPGGP
jgi:hypothetical protein